MAKTEEEILSALEDNITAIDPTIQTKHGPVRDFLLRPLPSELAALGAETERLANIYKLEFLETSGTTQDIEAYQNNFGLTVGSGRKATGIQTFFRSEAPAAGELITIPVGALVSNSDRTSTYKVTEAAVMDGDFASTFFNAGRRRYEVTAQTEALNIGVNNNLPADRVQELVTPVSGVSGTTNVVAYSGGEDIDTSAVQFSRIQSRFAGLNLGSPNGVVSAVKEFDTSLVTDVKAVQPNQRDVFKRFVTTPALDVYVIGTKLDDAEDSFTSEGSETELALVDVPVASITSVTKNGEAEIVTLQIDDTEFAGSTRAVDRIVFSTALTTGDIINVKYKFNKLIPDIRDNIVGESDTDDSILFGTDILILEAISRLVTVHYSFSTFSSSERETVNIAIETALANAVTLDTFTTGLRPIDVQTAVINNVVGLSRFVIERFQPTVGGLVRIETVFFKDNERSVLDVANLSVIGV